MHAIDLAIIGVYFLLLIAVGWWTARKAARDSESYFLAGKSLPWWIIGVAHGSSGIDITGTMWFVTMLFVYGVKATWLLWVWPLFNVIFRMMYLGTWVRRSNVLTGAEWMRTRFGTGVGAELAYLSVVLYALVSVVGFLSYAFRGIGKFAKPFLPWTEAPGPFAAFFTGPAGLEHFYATVILLVTGIYCVVGGMYSVVLNDLIQYALILLAAVSIAVIAIVQTSPEQILEKVPAGWDNLFFGWQLNLDWSNLIPQLNDKLYGATGDGYGLFGFFIGMLFLKGVLVSLAGPTPNYAIQHILSTRSPREAALENFMMALTSLGPRFLMIAGIAVLGIVFFSQDLAGMGAKVDFELILPAVVQQYLPVGCRGLLLAALLAAFMSTFVSTVNSGAAYVVNDLYKRYLDPEAKPRRLVIMGYLTSVVVILAGIAFGFVTSNVHSITKWVVAALVPAFVAPNVLKWHWWRFNGYGFFAGMIGGTAAAILVPALPGLAGFAARHLTGTAGAQQIEALQQFAQVRIPDVWLFMSVIAISSLASVVFCLWTRPEPDEVLMKFYRSVRPWGWWGPVLARCRETTPRLEPNRDFRRDVFNLAVGLVWQTSMVALPIYLVLQQWGRVTLCVVLFLATSAILKFTWYDRLSSGDGYLAEDR